MCKKFTFLISFIVVLSLAGNAFGQPDKAWDNLGLDNLWMNPDNWEPNGVPDNSDDVGQSLEGPGSAILIDFTHVDPCQARSNNFFVGDGTYQATGLTPCYLYVTGGSFIPDNTWRVGYLANGNGVVEISGGTIISEGGANDRLIIGNNGGTGVMTISGGSVSITEEIRVGWTGNNIYPDSNGTLTITGGTLRSGTQDNGHVTVPRGMNNLEDANIFGTLNIHGGTVYVGTIGAPGGASSDLRIGTRSAATGVFNMTDGHLIITDDFEIGQGNWQTDGEWRSPTTARAYISGGTIDIGDELNLGQRPNHDCELHLSGTAVINIGAGGGNHDFRVGRATGYTGQGKGGVGKFYMTGGEVNILGDDLRIPNSNNARGYAYLEGGTITIEDDIGRASEANETVVEMTEPMLMLFNNEGAGDNIGEFLEEDWLYYGGVDTTDPCDDRHFVYDYNIRNFEQTTLTARGASQIDYALAWGPQPRNFQNTQPDPTTAAVTVTWKPGDFTVAGRHVYFGTDFDEVNDANTNDDVYLGHTNALEWPDLPVAMDSDFFWRVDEVLAGNVHYKGETWRFHCQMWMPIEDFEDYEGTEWESRPDQGTEDDPDPNHDLTWLRDVWVDYYVNDILGAVIALAGSPSQGSSSMELEYKNDGTFYDWSEAYRPLVPDQNWHALELKAIRLSYYGDPCNTLEPNETLYIVLRDSGDVEEVMPCPRDPCELLVDSWENWNIASEDFTVVDVNNIEGLYIGVGHRDEAMTGFTTMGHVYIDNIRLYIPRCVRGGPDGSIPYLNPYSEFVGWPGGCIVDWVDLQYLSGEDEWLDYDYTIDVNSELVGHWDFNESSGETAADTSGKGHNGTLRNMDGNTCWQGGYYGNALFFDPNVGNGYIVDANLGFEYVRMPFSEDFNDRGNDKVGMTWAMWVKTNYSDPCARWDWWYADHNDQPGGVNDINFPRVTIIAKADPCEVNEMPFGSNATRLRLDAQGELRYQCNNNFRALDTDVQDGYWHHVAVTVKFQTLKDGSAHNSQDTARIYVDGGEEELFDGNTPTPVSRGLGYDGANQQGQADPEHIIVIGGKTGTGAHPFSGWIDDVQIFNYALDPNQLQTVIDGGTVPNTQDSIYFDLDSNRNLYDEEPTNERFINFKDFAKMADWWLKQSLWPKP